MPVNQSYPLAELIDAARRYRQKRRKRVMFEYTLLAGINDSDEDARRLAVLLREVRCKINLLAVNPVAGYTVFIRQSRGSDISAACGQLAGKTMSCHAAAQQPAAHSSHF